MNLNINLNSQNDNNSYSNTNTNSNSNFYSNLFIKSNNYHNQSSKLLKYFLPSLNTIKEDIQSPINLNIKKMNILQIEIKKEKKEKIIQDPISDEIVKTALKKFNLKVTSNKNKKYEKSDKYGKKEKNEKNEKNNKSSKVKRVLTKLTKEELKSKDSLLIEEVKYLNPDISIDHIKSKRNSTSQAYFDKEKIKKLLLFEKLNPSHPLKNKSIISIIPSNNLTSNKLIIVQNTNKITKISKIKDVESLTPKNSKKVFRLTKSKKEIIGQNNNVNKAKSLKEEKSIRLKDTFRNLRTIRKSGEFDLPLMKKEEEKIKLKPKVQFIQIDNSFTVN